MPLTAAALRRAGDEPLRRRTIVADRHRPGQAATVRRPRRSRTDSGNANPDQAFRYDPELGRLRVQPVDQGAVPRDVGAPVRRRGLAHRARAAVRRPLSRRGRPRGRGPSPRRGRPPAACRRSPRRGWPRSSGSATASGRSTGSGGPARSAPGSRARGRSAREHLGRPRGWAKKPSTRPAIARLKIASPARHRPDRAGQLLLVGVLEHVAPRPARRARKTESSSSNRVSTRTRHRDRPRRSPGWPRCRSSRAAADPSGRRPAAGPRPGPPPPRRTPLRPRPRCPARLQQGHDALAEQRVVLDDQHAGRPLNSLPPAAAGRAPACHRRTRAIAARAAHLRRPLAHGGQPHARHQPDGRQPDAVVGDLHDQRVGVDRHRTQPSRARAWRTTLVSASCTIR